MPRIEIGEVLRIDGKWVFAKDGIHKEAEEKAVIMMRECKKILEVGYGLGCVHKIIRKSKPDTHWLIEKYEGVIPKSIVVDSLIISDWKDVWNELPAIFDGIYFDPYPDWKPPERMPFKDGIGYLAWYNDTKGHYMIKEWNNGRIGRDITL